MLPACVAAFEYSVAISPACAPALAVKVDRLPLTAPKLASIVAIEPD